MAIYKNNNGTWYVMIRYQDWTGARKQKCKRGFSTRKEAADWELQFKLQKKASVDMTMESFCTMYEEDVRPSLKQSTWLTKENIIQKKILPYLGKRKVSEITAKDATIDFLLDERIRELVGEELRRFTLVRTGKLVERVKKYNPHSNTMDEHHTLWPIPQTIIDSNTGAEFPQNPGY